VVADRPLGEAEGLDQMADTGFVVGLGLDEAEDAKTDRLGQHLEDTGELVGLVCVERALEERRAAGKVACLGVGRSRVILAAVALEPGGSRRFGR
jgi:hypothetical protein